MAKLLNRKVPVLQGRKIALSLPRKFVGDLLHFAKKVPSVPMQRRMHLGDVVAARRALPHRFSWCSIFMKAYSIVAAARPELRRTYLSFPWGHLYEHPANVANFSVERSYQDQDEVFFAQVASPESTSLRVLDQMVRAHKTADIETIDNFRRTLWLSRLPLPIRRLLWWIGLDFDGRFKAYYFGTFGISVVASAGAAGLHLLSPLSNTLNYGTFEPDGSIDVRLAYDHRVIDGSTAARALVAIDEVLHGEICAELRAGAKSAAVKADAAKPAPLTLSADYSPSLATVAYTT